MSGQYLQNLEALRANDGVIQPLVAAMDEVLARGPVFAFEGRAEGDWRQTIGPTNPKFAETARTTSADFARDADRMQVRHALAYGSTPQREQSYDLLTFTMTGKPSDYGAGFVRRCGVVGLRCATEHDTADQYRIEVPTRDVVYTCMLSRLGGVAVQAEDYQRPTQTMEFAKRCLAAFSDKAAVDALMAGDFISKQDFARLLDRLSDGADQEPLKTALRDYALSTKAGIAFAQEFNLHMPDRERLVTWRTAVQQLFGAA
jgi:hypothetical protein